MENIEVKEEKKERRVKRAWREVVHFFKKGNKQIVFFIVSFVVLLVCCLGVIGLGTYRFGWDNKFVNTIVKVFAFPAAIVDGRVIKYSDWQEEARAVVIWSKKQSANSSQQQIEKDVLEKQIYDVLLKKMASRYDIKVTDVDINNKIEEITKQVGDKDKLLQNIRDYFGWDMAHFIKYIVYTEVLQDKLKDISANKLVLKEAEKRAKEVLSKVKKGDKKFEDLAKQYSDDPGSASKGGDLGWFPRGVMVKEFEDAAFNLKLGEISTLVKTQYGYHIILVEEKTVEDAAKGVKEQIKVSHILIAPETFESFLNKYRNEAKVYKFVAFD